jgi:hypothetical protein
VCSCSESLEELGVVLTIGLFLLDNVVGILERLLETFLETLMTSLANSLLLATSFGVFFLESSKTVSLGLHGSLGVEITSKLGVGVKLLHKGLVLQGVLVGAALLKRVNSSVAEFALNLIRVDNSSQVSASHQVSIKGVATLFDTLLTVGTEDAVELLEGTLGEDDKATEVTTRGELEEVESMDAAGVDTGEVTGGLLNLGLVIVNNKGSLGHLEARVSHLVETSTA